LRLPAGQFVEEHLLALLKLVKLVEEAVGGHVGQVGGRSRRAGVEGVGKGRIALGCSAFRNTRNGPNL